MSVRPRPAGPASPSRAIIRPVGLVDLLWRGAALFRWFALVYAAVLVISRHDNYVYPTFGWVALAIMTVWTAITTWAYSSRARRTVPLMTADLAVTLAVLASSHWIVGAVELDSGNVTLPVAWVAAPMLAWAIHAGRRVATIVALVIGAVDAAVRGWFVTGLLPEAGLNATALLLLTGFITAYVARLAVDTEKRLQQAAEREAAMRERERLARGIHDSVLQVLALIQRRGAELGGEAAELGRMAGEQEATLRALVSDGAGQDGGRPTSPDGTVDLRARLREHAGGGVTISTPATTVLLPATAADAIGAAVGAALDNVAVHCGPQAHAWVLVEAEQDAVTVTVRDDGPGIAAGRLAAAKDEGRLGVDQSIIGRIRDAGGVATITSQEGQGTEIELKLPWPA